MAMVSELGLNLPPNSDDDDDDDDDAEVEEEAFEPVGGRLSALLACQKSMVNGFHSTGFTCFLIAS